MLDLEAIKARCKEAIGHFDWLIDVGATTREEEAPMAIIRADIPALVAEVERLKVLGRKILDEYEQAELQIEQEWAIRDNDFDAEWEQIAKWREELA